jgi:hypothetical protein
MDALTLVGDRVEVVGRVGISEPSYPPHQLHGERIVGTELARLHLHMTNIASAQPSRADTASPSVTTSRRTARVANAALRTFSAARTPFACSTTVSQRASS